MIRQDNRHYIDILFVLLVFASFMLTALLLIAMGTAQYRKIVGNMDESDRLRTASAYITQKVRSSRQEGMIQTGTLEGIPALKIYTDIDGVSYITWIYAYEDQMCEQFAAEARDDVKAAGGTRIYPLNALEFSFLDEGLPVMNMDSPPESAAAGRILCVDITADDNSQSRLVLCAVP